ncbi:MAG: sigma 54-interacting transcriptional regulator [Polyangiales bacterium]
MPDDGEVFTVLRKLPPANPATAFAVDVVAGADLGAKLVLDGTIQGGRALLGASPACHLRLSDPLVSRRHASLESNEGVLRLTDLSSSNGTTVNGLSIAEVLLRGGETIVVGGTTLKVRVVTRAKPPVVSLETSFGRVVGASPAMRRLYPLLQRLAAATVPIVLEGETGTGKELVAEALHETGVRPAGPFVVFDCTAVPPSLVEAALFGHERGAFTGAHERRKGVFEQAHHGTLLIDEIGDLELSLQSKLLRAIERSEVRRVGGDKWLKVDVRVIAATRRDLDAEVSAGRFRDDLFFRLAVARVELPPLRKREGDVALLAQTFWTALGGEGAVPTSLLDPRTHYAWPGNVRELFNTVARHVAIGDVSEPELEAPQGAHAVTHGHDSSDFVEQVIARGLPFVEARRRVSERFERRYVEVLLERHGGNVSKAAAAAGIARRYFQIVKAKQRP